MKLFSEWLKLREAAPGRGGGTQKPKPSKKMGGDRSFVANTSQYWGPSATFGHEPRKLQTAAEKLLSAPVAAIGQSFKQSLGRDPGQVPTLSWQGIRKQFTDRHIILDITLPLQLVVLQTPECYPGVDDPNKCTELDPNFHPGRWHYSGEGRGASRNIELAQQFKSDSKKYMVVSPVLDNSTEISYAKRFTRALIQRDMWETLQRDGKATEIAFDDAKWEEKINPDPQQPTMTLIGMFPRIDKDIAQQRARALAER